jgi:hypothetical protein
MKYFRFMGEIVTDGVGHLRAYGPGGQVKGGRWKKGVKGLGVKEVKKMSEPFWGLGGLI